MREPSTAHHERHGQDDVLAPRQVGKVAVQRHLLVCSSGLGRSERHREDGVGAQVALVWRPVELDHARIELSLLRHVRTLQCSGDLANVGNGLEDALAGVALLVTVTELDGLVDASRRPARNSGREHASRRDDVALNGGEAARVEDLACVDG